MLPWLKAGATAFRTSFQCSSVGPVSRLVPPRNYATAITPHNVTAQHIYDASKNIDDGLVPR